MGEEKFLQGNILKDFDDWDALSDFELGEMGLIVNVDPAKMIVNYGNMLSRENSDTLKVDCIEHFRLTACQDDAKLMVKTKAFEVGKNYKVAGYLIGDGANSPMVFCGNDPFYCGTTIKSRQLFDIYFIATAEDLAMGTANPVDKGGYIGFYDLNFVRLDNLDK